MGPADTVVTPDERTERRPWRRCWVDWRGAGLADVAGVPRPGQPGLQADLQMGAYSGTRLEHRPRPGSRHSGGRPPPSAAARASTRPRTAASATGRGRPGRARRRGCSPAGRTSSSTTRGCRAFSCADRFSMALLCGRAVRPEAMPHLRFCCARRIRCWLTFFRAVQVVRHGDHGLGLGLHRPGAPRR